MPYITTTGIILIILQVASACHNQTTNYTMKSNPEKNIQQEDISTDSLQTATFAGGCFWCTEAIFRQLKGVREVKPGYTGGTKPNPTYKEVCDGNTGHAEAIRIIFDPSLVSYKELLEIFFKTHDPTTLDRQGNDVGTQYRSAIFYHNEQQRLQAADVINKLSELKAYSNPIVTEVTSASEFFVAEDYHHNYFNRNKNQPYCEAVIQPKVEKFEKVFKDKIKQ